MCKQMQENPHTSIHAYSRANVQSFLRAYIQKQRAASGRAESTAATSREHCIPNRNGLTYVYTHMYTYRHV